MTAKPARGKCTKTSPTAGSLRLMVISSTPEATNSPTTGSRPVSSGATVTALPRLATDRVVAVGDCAGDDVARSPHRALPVTSWGADRRGQWRRRAQPSSIALESRRAVLPPVRNSAARTRWGGKPRGPRGRPPRPARTNARRPLSDRASGNARATDRADKALPPSLRRDRCCGRRTWRDLQGTPRAARPASWRKRYRPPG